MSDQARDTFINEDPEARQNRWGSLIDDLEDDWDVDDEASNYNIVAIAPGISSEEKERQTAAIKPPIIGIGALNSTPDFQVFGGGPSLKFNMNNANGFQSAFKPSSYSQWGSRVGDGAIMSQQSTKCHPITVKAWISSHIGRGGDGKLTEVAERREYLEKCVNILRSLVGNIIGGGPNRSCEIKRSEGGGDDENEIWVHPNFITVENVTVRESNLMGTDSLTKLTTDFVECGDSIFCNIGENAARKKELAMDALGRMAYDMFMLGDGPSLPKFSYKSNVLGMYDRDIEGDTQTVIDVEDEIMAMLCKNPRTTTPEEKNCSGFISTMLDAAVPFPLCRFVSDLLDNDEDVMLLGRSEHSFSSFADVLSDINQMVDNPDAFLHASSPDRWKLEFGETLYGRDDAMKAFMDAADRVGTNARGDPLFDGLARLARRRKEVVMVRGHSGSGKSKLVRFGGASLEKEGWHFLRCKFDRVVHPEPLSIIAYAFDKYFQSFASGAPHSEKSHDYNITPLSDLDFDIRERLEETIPPEGLGILAEHIPSLRLILTDVALSTGTVEANETMMHALFGKLLQALSSRRTPLLLFIDDLQWADPLSLSLLTAVVNGAGSDLLNLSSTVDKQSSQGPSKNGSNFMFVGSFRDNEVNDDHQLAKFLRKLESCSSTNVTNISLSGFTVDTLNKMLSESLCLPARRVRSLSELVIQKTDGQPLHVIEFIQALTMDNLLTHSFTRGWEWDADSIEFFPITDSVAELFAFKLQRLPEDILLGLQIISCFGSQIDKSVLNFVVDYDGDSSVDICSAICEGLREGLVEQAAQFVSFTHDMIQKAAIDSISDDDLVPLLRKLSSALIRNASAARALDSVLFVIVDLINRIGSNATQSPKERKVFAELNLRAGSKAIAVPDFAGASKYAENGITFLHDSHWETQYDLSLCLYETSVLSQFSSPDCNWDYLKKRINAVFEHGKDFSDKFKTHCVWIKLLSRSDLQSAIKECLHALERLGEPLELENIDLNAVCKEIAKRKEQFSGDMKKKFLSTNRMDDCNKVRAMKIMSSLMIYYHQTKSALGAYVSCQMMKGTMDYGHCEYSVFAAAAFASSLVTVLRDVDEGSSWARTTLSLMEMYDTKNTLIPSVHGSLYGQVFVWKEPIQSTLEPLAQGIRSSFAMGNVEFAMINTIYYVARSFSSGKNVSVLLGEVGALTRQLGKHIAFDTSSSPILQFYLTPPYNTMRELEGDKEGLEEEEESFPLDKVAFVNNDDILNCALEQGQFSCVHTVLTYQSAKAFMLRDMDSAKRYIDLYFEHFLTKELGALYTSIWNDFYEALITFYFMRQTGEARYQVRGELALKKMKDWSTHSAWNFTNKLFLMEAELHNTQKDFEKAAMYYEASIKAAQDHKFLHEEAIANELAGLFFFERGIHPKSYSFFKDSITCYRKWGANAVATRIENDIQDKFDTNLMQLCPIEIVIFPSDIILKEPSSKKRQLYD